jgi:thimet oligopeptidase
MIGSAQAAQEFIDRIAKAAEPRARADLAALLARKRKDDPHATEVFDHERAYYEELVKREQYDFDAQSVRPYFEFNQTRDGLLAITAKLFDVEYRKVADAGVWHPDVDVYDVYQVGGAKLGRIFLDLHPRENKYKHAAQFPLVNGVAGKQLPEGVLVCNFPDPKASKGPALMDHDDVVTMFHEFGHLMHHILSGRQRWVYFSGVATEQDFVEAPSQMLEEWAWDPSTLALFARHVETHAPIPAELVARMRAANELGKGVFARTQMFYAALSLRYHELDAAHIDFTKTVAELQNRYSMFGYVDGTRFYDSFGHLNGYSAMYYTYMWSLVIAKDLLSEFQKHSLLDAKTAHHYRDTVLAPGGSKDAADLVRDFLGRPYSFDAYQRWLDRT